MSSQAQISANQTNAQFSTGPRSDAGKAASARNGLTHGLASTFTLLIHEDQSKFDALAAAVKADLQPANDHENFLVDQMIHARWRLARIDRLEIFAFEHMLDPAAPAVSPERKIIAYMIGSKNADVLGMLLRYRSAAERSFHKSYRELLHGRQTEQKMYQSAMSNFVKNVVHAPAPGQPVNPEIGFASQSAPNPPIPGPAAATAPKKPGVAESLGNLALRL